MYFANICSTTQIYIYLQGYIYRGVYTILRKHNIHTALIKSYLQGVNIVGGCGRSSQIEIMWLYLMSVPGIKYGHIKH